MCVIQKLCNNSADNPTGFIVAVSYILYTGGLSQEVIMS